MQNGDPDLAGPRGRPLVIDAKITDFPSGGTGSHLRGKRITLTIHIRQAMLRVRPSIEGQVSATTLTPAARAFSMAAGLSTSS